MEDDIQNYLTTVMFCGTPCIRIRSFYQTLSSFDEHILEFLQVSFESFLSFSIGSFLSFSIGSFLSFSIGSFMSFSIGSFMSFYWRFNEIKFCWIISNQPRSLSNFRHVRKIEHNYRNF